MVLLSTICLLEAIRRLPKRRTCGSGGHCQIANAHIDSNHLAQLLPGWVRYVNFQRNEERESFLWFIVPELGITNVCPMPNECDMLLVALVGKNVTAMKRSTTHLAVPLKG